jgi:hypothetical protein
VPVIGWLSGRNSETDAHVVIASITSKRRGEEKSCQQMSR